jgi:SAM-dependent methyltransferase
LQQRMSLEAEKTDAFSTFRDPSGTLTFSGNSCLRFVRPEYETEVLDFVRSSLYSSWQKRGDVIATEIREVHPQPFSLCLEHPRIFFPSYPWEWSPAQWLAAAELTLNLCDEAITEGWILKDATPLNILFDGTRPVFVDILSFARQNVRSPIWLAQAQFIRTFLLPLLAHRWLGWPLAAALLRRDGNEPEDLYNSLSWMRRVHPRLLWPVTLPVWLNKRSNTSGLSESATEKADSIQREPVVARYVLRRTVATLRRQVRHAAPALANSRWSGYQDHLCHYSSRDSEEKYQFILNVLLQHTPRTVMDIGANTGRYSILAARNGARVVALDSDAAAIERLWSTAVTECLDILPLVGNIARPTPSVGWENAESLSLMDRACGKFDMVLLLAVIHHIIVGEQIPLLRIASLCQRLTRCWLVVEWVPPTDPMFRKLIRGRDGLYGALREEDLFTAFRVHFEVVERHQLSNGRVLLLFKRRDR